MRIHMQVLEGPFASVVGGGDGSSEQWAVLLLKILLDQTLFSALINLLYASFNGLLSNLPPKEAFARARQVHMHATCYICICARSPRARAPMYMYM